MTVSISLSSSQFNQHFNKVDLIRVISAQIAQDSLTYRWFDKTEQFGALFLDSDNFYYLLLS